ncbi:PREDICTED: mitochondrial amidoxime reducing component 2-like isoform X4 [Crocodylus porosus]|uniref:mitochondrial amidoxime reducing component 2-like isoform X4 n=1 Tax=Crocodylus porosus TaxID=8502 RepID=UPI00093C99C5|nr:PREDICTED: mitochondrial amidoxime reducing component 2-like isoform X4 [Crocodylus porosus]
MSGASWAAYVGASAALALALAVSAALAWRWGGRRRRLQRVGSVAALFLYPVKSCGGAAVRRAELTALGLRSGDLRDRFWLVIKEDGHMVTGRQEPRLVLISVSCGNGYLMLSAPEMKELRVPIKLSRKNKVHNCRIFGFDVQGRDCGDEAAEWITSFLTTQPYRLVHFETSMMPRNSKDIMPVFRPTDKDSWDEICIGSVDMKGTMGCPRCLLTTIDPETGIMDRKEPLETLKSYRLCDPSEQYLYKSSPLFGWYFGVDKTGTIQVGDPVYKIIK